jgi:hypothetical protein
MLAPTDILGDDDQRLLANDHSTYSTMRICAEISGERCLRRGTSAAGRASTASAPTPPARTATLNASSATPAPMPRI